MKKILAFKAFTAFITAAVLLFTVSVPAVFADDREVALTEDEIQSQPETVTADTEDERPKYTNIADLPAETDDLEQLISDWLAYPEYYKKFHPVKSECIVKAEEKTMLNLFRSSYYSETDYEWAVYGGGEASFEWIGVGWGGHSHLAYVTGTQAGSVIFVTATDALGLVAHMIIRVE